MKIKLKLVDKNNWKVYRGKKLIGTIWEATNGLEKEWESAQTGVSWSSDWTLSDIAHDLNNVYEQHKGAK